MLENMCYTKFMPSQHPRTYVVLYVLSKACQHVQHKQCSFFMGTKVLVGLACTSVPGSVHYLCIPPKQRQQTPELQRTKQHQPKSKSKQATIQRPSQSKQPTNVQVKASNQPKSKSNQATNQRPSQSKQPTNVQVKASNQPKSKSKQATNQSPSQSKQPTNVQVKASNQPTSKSKQATNQSPSITSVVDNSCLSLSYHAHDNLAIKLVIMKLSKLSDHVCYVM